VHSGGAVTTQYVKMKYIFFPMLPVLIYISFIPQFERKASFKFANEMLSSHSVLDKSWRYAKEEIWK
jgi:hypothetical protein